MIRRSLALGFEAIDGGEIAPVEGTVTDGIAVDDVIEAGEGGEETGALATDIETVSATIEDMLGVDEGLEEKVEEVANVDASEVTGDTVVAAMEALSQAIAISGVDFQKSSIGFESIGSNPSRALSVALEDYKDFFKRLWAQIKEFFKKLMLGFKKIFVAVMKWTAADVDACDKLIKKIKEGKEIAAISQKDGTIFKSTETKVKKALAGYLAAVNHQSLVGAQFATGLKAVIAEANDEKNLKEAADACTVLVSADLKTAEIKGLSVKLDNFSEAPKDIKINSKTINPSGMTLVYSKTSGSKPIIGEVAKLTVKTEFISGIKVSDVKAGDLISVLETLKKAVQGNKRFFEQAEKNIIASEKVSEEMIKALGEDGDKWAKIGFKVMTRLVKNGIYDSVLGQIKANKAVLSVCKTIATGSADKEEKK